MDIFDQAQAADARFRDQAIAAVRSLSSAEGNGQPSAEACGWCEQEIPEARRQAVPGCTLCARCQGEKERLPGRNFPPPQPSPAGGEGALRKGTMEERR